MRRYFWLNRVILQNKHFQYQFDRSKTRHDRAKIGLAGQHDRPPFKNYFEPCYGTLDSVRLIGIFPHVSLAFTEHMSRVRHIWNVLRQMSVNPRSGVLFSANQNKRRPDHRLDIRLIHGV